MTQQIGKYQIVEKIGQGGFGDVYLAEDTMLGSQVALKVLAPVYMRDPTVVRRFQQEARAAARLRHPNIVRIYDLGEGDGMLYLAMDYLAGRTLAEVIRGEGPLPLERVADLLAQVASALDYAHSRGLIHRDVKPGNVMVSEEGHATLMDFGLVKAADHTQFTLLYRTADSEQFTTGGGTIGTPEYMAPEQADPSLGEVGPLSDLYALGIMAYQMVTGRVPFQASTPIATLRAHADLAPPPPSQWVEVPEEVAGVVLRALAKQPEERWPGAGAFADAVAKAVAESQAAATQESELAALYARVEEALAGQQWALALGLCGQLMTQAPAYRRIEDLFERANEGLVRQRDWETQQDELATLYDEAVPYMAEANWDEAILLLEQIQEQSQPYTFRDVPQRLAEAREAQARAESERLVRMEETQQEVLALAEQLDQALGEWAGLRPSHQEAQPVKDAVDSLLDRWRGVAMRESASITCATDEAEIPDRPEEQVAEELAAVEEEIPQWLTELLADELAVVEEEEEIPEWLAEVMATDPEVVDAGDKSPIWQQIGIEMVTIPPGEFLYGEKKERIYLPEYAMAKTPVTNRQYEAFVDTTGYKSPMHWSKERLPPGKEEHPVVNVSWHDAVAFCEWAGCRLPTEQEWEKAARGTDGQMYPWGDRWEDGRCNTYEAGIGDTTPVGRYPNGASPYGLLDMAGNVCEWCEDWHDSRRGYKVLRGGSWSGVQFSANSASRNRGVPGYQYYNFGFRCVLLPTSSP